MLFKYLCTLFLSKFINFLFIFKDLLAREKKHEEELEVERKKRKEEEKVIIYLFLVVEVD